MFREFVFHVLSISFLMVCFVRLQSFVASLDIVFVTTRTAEIANTVGVPEAGRESAISCVGYPPSLGCFRKLEIEPRQSIDRDLFVIPLNDRQILDERPCLRLPKRRGIHAKPKDYC